MRATLAAIVVLALVIARPSYGTDEWAFEAFQPIWTDSNIWLERLAVITFNSGDPGVYAVLATCDSNQVMTDYGPQQRNVAFEAGLKAEVTFNSQSESSLFGDTLRVMLRSTKPAADFEDFSYSTIVAATVECILANAAQSQSIRFVALRVEGVERKRGGVFATKTLRSGPRKRDFH